MSERQGAEALHQVAEGRLFCRQVGPGYGAAPGVRRCALFGVVALPRAVDLERMHAARVNANLWVDVASSSAPTGYAWPDLIGEEDAGGLLRSMRFRSGALPDAVEFFVRAAPMPHSDPSRMWAFLIGAAARPLDVMPQDGLYDVGAGGVRLLDADPHAGEQPGGILRAPLWGPGGQYGFVSSMEPDTYARWLPAERERQLSGRSAEPGFVAFHEAMTRRFPDSALFYTADQLLERDAFAARVMKTIVAADEEFFAQRRTCSSADDGLRQAQIKHLLAAVHQLFHAASLPAPTVAKTPRRTTRSA